MRGLQLQRGWLLACVLAVASTAAGAGQVSSAFQIRVQLVPAGCGGGVLPLGECGAGGQVPDVPGVPTPGGNGGGSNPAPAGLLPALQAWAHGGALVRRQETGDMSGILFGEYSSRTIVAGEFEYLEMTVSW